MTAIAAAMSAALERPIACRRVAAGGLNPKVKARLATQRWCEAIGWRVDIAARAAWPVPLTSLADWARHRAAALIGDPAEPTALAGSACVK